MPSDASIICMEIPESARYRPQDRPARPAPIINTSGLADILPCCSRLPDEGWKRGIANDPGRREYGAASWLICASALMSEQCSCAIRCQKGGKEPLQSVKERRQLFFAASFRFNTMSMRVSKLETLRVWDFAPSFSACSS